MNPFKGKVRNPPQPRSLMLPHPPRIPDFSGRQYATGTLTATGDILNPRAAATVQWVEVMATGGGTIQLLLNGLGASVVVPITGSGFVRFGGLMLPNNAKLSLAITGTISASFSAPWLLGFFSDLVQTETQVNGPVGVTATPRQQFLETSTPLNAGATFTGPWHDSTIRGENYVSVVAVSNQPFAPTNGVQIIESEDQVNTSAIAFLGASATIRMSGVIRARYWRVIVTAGASNEASLAVYTTASLVPIASGTGSTRYTNAWDQSLIALPGNIGALSDSSSKSNFIGPTDSLGQAGVLAIAELKALGYTNGGGLFYGRPRMPQGYKFAIATNAGSTALWTPQAGKKFNLLRWCIGITNNASLAAAGILTVKLLDSATDIGMNVPFFVNNAAGTAVGSQFSKWFDLGEFGYFSALVNNVLNINLSAALVTGQVFAFAAGGEE